MEFTGLYCFNSQILVHRIGFVKRNKDSPYVSTITMAERDEGLWSTRKEMIGISLSTDEQIKRSQYRLLEIL